MFWTWSKLLTGLTVAMLLVAPLGTAHHENGTGQTKATVDDVLDDPQHFMGQEVTLEGEIDHIYSTTTFAMEDDQDLIGDDEILILSVMPVATRAGAAGASNGVTTTQQDMAPIPVVELVGLVDDRFEEGKIVRATGTVRMFDRAALEREFGTIDFGTADLEEFQHKPVVIMGARQYAELKQRGTEQLAVVIQPEPIPAPLPEPEPELIEPEPQAEPEPIPEPEAAPAPEPQEPAVVEPEPAPEELPKTASPMAGVALAGLLSLALGLGIRFRR